MLTLRHFLLLVLAATWCLMRRTFPLRLAPYGVYAGVQRDVVISLLVIVVLVLAIVVILLCGWTLKSRRRKAQVILSRRDKQVWLVQCAKEVQHAGPTYHPPSAAEFNQLTPHRLRRSSETIFLESGSMHNGRKHDQKNFVTIESHRSTSFAPRYSTILSEQDFYDAPPTPCPSICNFKDAEGHRFGVELKVDQKLAGSRLYSRPRPPVETLNPTAPRHSKERLPLLAFPDVSPEHQRTTDLRRFNSYEDELDQGYMDEERPHLVDSNERMGQPVRYTTTNANIDARRNGRRSTPPSTLSKVYENLADVKQSRAARSLRNDQRNTPPHNRSDYAPFHVPHDSMERYCTASDEERWDEV